MEDLKIQDSLKKRATTGRFSLWKAPETQTAIFFKKSSWHELKNVLDLFQSQGRQHTASARNF
jgi:hypothetical protein